MCIFYRDEMNERHETYVPVRTNESVAVVGLQEAFLTKNNEPKRVCTSPITTWWGRLSSKENWFYQNAYYSIKGQLSLLGIISL
jgi:hypothetical protein